MSLYGDNQRWRKVSNMSEKKPPKVKQIIKWVYIPETTDLTQNATQKYNILM
jgi:hypothetical protein